MFLPGQAPLADEFDLHLSAMEHQPVGLVAISLSAGDYSYGACRFVAGAPALAGPAGRNAVLLRYAVSGFGVPQRLPVPLFPGSRSFSIPGQLGDYHALRRRACPVSGFFRSGLQWLPGSHVDHTFSAWCADVASKPTVPRRGNAVPYDAFPKPVLLDGPQ